MKHLVAGALVAVLLLAGLISLPNARAQGRVGGQTDSLLWYQQPIQDQALVDLTSGTMDVYMFPLRTAASIAAARSNPDLWTIDVGGSLNNLFINPVAVSTTPAPPDGVGNPFVHREIREAMNYIIDRDFISQEIAGGSQFPHITLENRLNPEYGRDAVYDSRLERNYSFDFDKGASIISSTLSADTPLYRFSAGKWQIRNSIGVYHDLVLNFVIRTEDIRKDIGLYIAGQLEKLGFGVNRMILSGSAAFAIVYNGPVDTGAWQLYTEGWAATALTAWSDTDPNFYFCGGEGSNVWGVYDVSVEDPPLWTVCENLLNANYTSLAQRQQWFEEATSLSLRNAVRVWVTAGGTFAVSKRVTGMVYDLSGGAWGLLASRTARFTNPGGTLHVGQRLQYLSPWNPWQGFGWLYDALQEYAFSDPAVWPHPHTGLYMPIRSTFAVTAPSPTNVINVPSTAQIWDPTTLGFTTVGTGVTAKSSVAYTFTFGTWHDGEPFTMDDVLYELALVYRRACAPAAGGVCGTAGGDVYAKDNDAATFASILLKNILRGFTVSGNQLTVYYDYWNVDPTTIAAQINPAFPVTPWPASQLALSTVFDDTCRISEVTAENEAKVALDLTKGNCLARMDLNLPTVTGTLPPGLSFDPTEAATRWADLANFRTTYGHFFVSNGPYILTKVDEATLQTTMALDTSYPIAANAYDAFLVPRIPQISFAPPSLVLIGRPAQFEVKSTLQGGGAYDLFDMTWLLVNPATGGVLYQGQPTKVAAGEYTITLTGTQTDALAAGAYELRTITVGKEAAVPVIVSQSFIAIPDVVTIVDELRGEINSLQQSFNTQLQDQKNLTAQAQAQVATLQTLVIASMAVALIAVIVAVVAIVRIRSMPRRPKGGMPPAEEEI
ncbi:MAG TPA: ABC transporter substrate-binding protein [Thermoplasmata archaeon]